MPLTRTLPAIQMGVALLALLAGPPVRAQGPGVPVPVTVAPAIRQDVPVIQRASGTVQAFQSVTLRARVDGTLDRILFTEGQRVQAGELLAQLDPRPYQAILDQAGAKKAADEAVLANARGDLARYADLANSQAASRQRLDLQRANVAQAEAMVRGDAAAVAAAQLNLGFTRIVAPFPGRVGLRLADVGTLIRAADQNAAGIVAIAQIQPIAVLFTVPQDSLPQVHAAMRRGKPAVAAYGSDGRALLGEGVLLTMDNAIDAATGTIKLKAIFPNPDDALWPGQFVNVRLRLATRRDVATVPSAAAQRGPGGLYVYLVRPDGTARRHPIEIDQDDGQLAVVSHGLQGGETVVVAGQSRLSDGTQVAAAAPPPAAPDPARP